MITKEQATKAIKYLDEFGWAGFPESTKGEAREKIRQFIEQQPPATNAAQDVREEISAIMRRYANGELLLCEAWSMVGVLCGRAEGDEFGFLQGITASGKARSTLIRNQALEEAAKECDPYTHGQWFANKIRALKTPAVPCIYVTLDQEKIIWLRRQATELTMLLSRLDGRVNPVTREDFVAAAKRVVDLVYAATRNAAAPDGGV